MVLEPDLVVCGTHKAAWQVLETVLMWSDLCNLSFSAFTHKTPQKRALKLEYGVLYLFYNFSCNCIPSLLSPVDPGPGGFSSSCSSRSLTQLKSSKDRRNKWKARGPRLGRMSSSFRVFCLFVGWDSTTSTWESVKTSSWYRNGTIVSLTSSCPDRYNLCVRSTALCTGSMLAESRDFF